MDLTAITGRTVEKTHLFNVHLGETIAPYVTLEPLKALLPIKQGEAAIPANDRGPGGIRLGGLDRRMRERWQTVSGLWEENKAPANRLNLLGQLDYMGKLSSQLEWQSDPQDRPVRVVYTSAGQPTASIIEDDRMVVDYKLFWIACKDSLEANWLLAIINSDALQEAVKPLMSKGQFGARDLQKHLWKLPIPEFDPTEDLHVVIAEAGAKVARKAQEKLASLQKQYQQKGKELTVAIVRRELRTWLRTSGEGRAVESAVGKLLAGG